LHGHHLKSTKGVKILGYITSAKIGDGSCMLQLKISASMGKNKFTYMSGSHHSVAISQMSKSLPRFRLAAVIPFQELHQVKANAALLKAHTKKDLDYDAYSSLYCHLLQIMIVSILLIEVTDKFMHMTL
jgi:hypothetical protein